MKIEEAIKKMNEGSYRIPFGQTEAGKVVNAELERMKANKELKQHITAMKTLGNQMLNGDFAHGYRSAIYEIEEEIKLLDASDKYRWHDLRKDPSDLPTDDKKECLVSVKIGKRVAHFVLGYSHDLHGIDRYDFRSGEIGFYELDSEWGYVKRGGVIAWREIEPFELFEEIKNDE